MRPAPAAPRKTSAPATAWRFAADSLKTGAYEFIPLPFVDDWLIGRQRRRMVAALLGERGFTCEAGAPQLLAAGSRTFLARLGSMARGAVVKPLRKAFRTVFFWLTARRAARTVVETYFLGRFLLHPSFGPENGGTHLTRRDARRLARVFAEASRDIDLKAARDVVERVRRLLARRPPGRLDPAELRGAIEQESPGFVAEFDSLVARKAGGG